MKALQLVAYNELVYKEVPKPKIQNPTEVLIRIKAAAICGSDVAGIDGSTGRRQPPIIMGHEGSGVIEEIGSGVTMFKVGDRVTFDSTIFCGICSFCKGGLFNLCDNRRVLGVSCDEYHRDGIFAEYAIVEERVLFALPEALDFVSAAFTEPAGVAAHAISLAAPKLAEDVAVIGSGLIGLLIIKLLRGMTAGRIFALDIDSSRREKALEVGADYAFDPNDPALVDEVNSLTSGAMIPLLYEAVGATDPINTALSLTRKGGTVVLVGNLSPKVEIPLQQVVTKQISLLGSCAINGEYPAVLSLMASGKLDISDLISAVAPLADGAEWFKKLYNKEEDLLKVILTPEEK